MFYDYYVHVITTWVFLSHSNNRKGTVKKAIDKMYEYYNHIDDEHTSHEFVIVVKNGKTERY